MNGLGLEKLVEKLLEYWDKLLPFETINHYDRGVRLRFGKAVLDKAGKPKILQPGFHWKISFVDEINSIMVKTATMDVGRQFVTTKDGLSIIVRGVLKYDVEDVGTLLLEVDSPKDAVSDMTAGIIKGAVAEKKWDEINGPDLDKQISIRVRREAKKWGIRVESLTLTDLMLVPSTMILNI